MPNATACETKPFRRKQTESKVATRNSYRTISFRHKIKAASSYQEMRLFYEPAVQRHDLLVEVGFGFNFRQHGLEERFVGIRRTGDGQLHLFGRGGKVAGVRREARLGKMAQPVIGIAFGNLRIDFEGAFRIASTLQAACVNVELRGIGFLEGGG